MRPRRPVGLTGHVAVIVVAMVLVLIAGGIAFYIYDRAETMRRFTALNVADRIVAIVELMEETPKSDRPAFLRALSGRLGRARLVRKKPRVIEEGDREIDEFRRLLRPHLRSLGDRKVLIGKIARDRRKLRHVRPPPGPFGSRPRGHVAIAVSQSDGRWLVFRGPLRLVQPRWERRIIMIIVIAAIVIIGFAVWAVHRVTRPLVRFAEAADRLGVDVRAPPLPERGSREVREVTRAFNRMQERLRRLIDDRTLMLAAISHDLKTVLTRLKLRAEFIEESQQQEKAVADIDEMQAMIDATLSFARDDTAEEQRTTVDLSSLLQSLCDDMADAGQWVVFDGPDRLPYRGQPVALRRAFANLIDNGVKYGTEATVTLGSGSDEILIEVDDRGAGIPEDMREKVFTPFFRLEGSRSRETGGTGLGLAVARSVFRRHGGDVTLHSRAGGGLSVKIVLPIENDGG